MAGGSGSHVGTGGMITKIWAAKRAARSGAHTVIASGRAKNALPRLLQGILGASAGNNGVGTTACSAFGCPDFGNHAAGANVRSAAAGHVFVLFITCCA